jgi:hypothetical protein
MRNLAFVIWLLGNPLFLSLSDLLNVKAGAPHLGFDNCSDGAFFLWLALYMAIAFLVYEPKPVTTLQGLFREKLRAEGRNL